MRKAFIDVIVKYLKDGQQMPMVIIWDNGHRYDIDRVLDIRKAASLKVGGQGTRYTCRIKGKQTYLWLEDGKWFVEAK
jgi:hypothetical protein